MNVDSFDQPACLPECPHFERVAGTCTHELRQDLVAHFLQTSPRCPVFDRWRAERMAELAADMGRDR